MNLRMLYRKWEQSFLSRTATSHCARKREAILTQTSTLPVPLPASCYEWKPRVTNLVSVVINHVYHKNDRKNHHENRWKMTSIYQSITSAERKADRHVHALIKVFASRACCEGGGEGTGIGPG